MNLNLSARALHSFGLGFFFSDVMLFFVSFLSFLCFFCYEITTSGLALAYTTNTQLLFTSKLHLISRVTFRSIMPKKQKIKISTNLKCWRCSRWQDVKSCRNTWWTEWWESVWMPKHHVMIVQQLISQSIVSLLQNIWYMSNKVNLKLLNNKIFGQKLLNSPTGPVCQTWWA